MPARELADLASRLQVPHDVLFENWAEFLDKAGLPPKRPAGMSTISKAVTGRVDSRED
jgi:hypothetical protein